MACLVTRRPLTDEQTAALRAALSGRISVLIGQSGVGKSTLVNALVPDAHRVTGVVNPVTGRGRHTSSSAVALPLPGGGWIIDTPGVRGFGLGHVSPAAGAWRPFPIWPGPRPTARPVTTISARTAGWTSGRASTARRHGWTRCAGCCAAARARNRPEFPLPYLTGWTSTVPPLRQ